MTQGFLRALGRTEELLCLVAFVLVALSLGADLALRELLGNGLVWSHQTAVYANILLVMCGIGLASARGAHLRPRFADHLLPRRWDEPLGRLAHLLSALVYLFFAILALALVWETQQLGERAVVLRIPVWPVQMLIPLAFFLAALRHFLYSCLPQLAVREQSPTSDGTRAAPGAPGADGV